MRPANPACHPYAPHPQDHRACAYRVGVTKRKKPAAHRRGQGGGDLPGRSGVPGPSGKGQAYALFGGGPPAMHRAPAGQGPVTDPRTVANRGMIGGGPHEHHTTLIDPRNMILPDETVVAVGYALPGPRAMVNLVLSGRVNGTTDRATVGFMMCPRITANLLTELLGLIDRAQVETQMREAITANLRELAAVGSADLSRLRDLIDAASR